MVVNHRKQPNQEGVVSRQQCNPESSRDRKPDNPEQFRRFLEIAREVGADEADIETFDRVLKKVARSSRQKPEPKTRRPRKPKDRA